MDFFEGLRERAGYKIEEDFATPTDYRHRIGINATIEALKEMMVGKPIAGFRIIHRHGGYSAIKKLSQTKGETLLSVIPHWVGTDGEEVTVLVFRDDKEK